jgi:hypothetical protein
MGQFEDGGAWQVWRCTDVKASKPSSPSHFMRIDAASLHQSVNMVHEFNTTIARCSVGKNGFRVPTLRTGPE